MVPAKGTIVDDAKVTLLAEGEPMEELVTTGRIGDVDRFAKHQVLVEGVVDRQNTNDANHDELTLVMEGRPVIVHLLPAATTPVAALEGGQVRIRGFSSATADPGGARRRQAVRFFQYEFRRALRGGRELAPEERESLDRLGALSLSQRQGCGLPFYHWDRLAPSCIRYNRSDTAQRFCINASINLASGAPQRAGTPFHW